MRTAIMILRCLEALDIELLNRDMYAASGTESVWSCRMFNFKTGKREYKGNFITDEGRLMCWCWRAFTGLNDKTDLVASKRRVNSEFISVR